MALPDDARRLMDRANYVHLATIRADGTPRNWVVWVDVEGDRILVCTGETSLKAKDMRRNPAVALSVTSGEDPYDMAAVQGRVVEVPRRRRLPLHGPHLDQVHRRAVPHARPGTSLFRHRCHQGRRPPARLSPQPGLNRSPPQPRAILLGSRVPVRSTAIHQNRKEITLTYVKLVSWKCR